MAEVTDPHPADRGRIDGADGPGPSTRQCAGQPPVLRVPDLTGLTTGVPVYSSVEGAAGIASPQRAARPVPESDAQAIVAGLLTVRPGRQQEEGQRWPSPAAHRG